MAYSMMVSFLSMYSSSDSGIGYVLLDVKYYWEVIDRIVSGPLRCRLMSLIVSCHR